MASLGFRHPQFSEDLAWLPDWLQQCQSEFPAEQLFEDAAPFRENVGEDKRSESSSKDEGGYVGCRLFLSGEDGSTFLSGEDGSSMSYAQPPGKVLHLNLRFSYNSGSQSQCTKSQESNASLAGFQSSKGAQIQRFEVAARPVEKVRAGVHGENLRRHLRDADVNAAVELSIAASEAMAIHELVVNESALKSLPAAAVVEVALRVKEARLKGSEELSDSVIKRIEEDIDLDDIAMLDAFKDVGLSFIDYNERGMSDFDISQVKETPSSQIHCDNGSPREETRIDFNKMNAQNHAHDVLALEKQPRSDSLLEYSQYECTRSGCGDKYQNTPTFNVASHVDTMLHQSALKESLVLTVEKVGSGLVENALREWQAESFVNNISQCPGNTVEYREVYLTEERFQSRWLGGWSTKGIEAPVDLKESSMRTRSIAKFFVHETSFLSESADIAPDENSVVQIGSSTQKASQLNMAFEGSCDEVNEGITFSQEIVKSSSLSSADPLCSFVPCSVSTENHGLHQESGQINGEKFNDQASELGLESPNKTSDPKFEADNQNTVVASEPKEGFQMSARRQLSSLKTYSVILSGNEGKLENGHWRSNLMSFSKCNREIASSYPDTNFTQNNGWQNSVVLKSPNSRHDIPGMACGEEHVPVTKHPDENTAFHRSISAQPAKDAAALQVHLPAKRKLPLMSDDRKWRHNMDSQQLVGGRFRGSNLKRITLPLNAANIDQCKNNHVPGRKRVSFSSEVDFQLQLGKSTHRSFHQNGSTTGSWKRLRYCNSRLECQSQGAKQRTSFMAEQTLIFHKMEFLLTGFSTRKEKEIERLIQKHGGEVLLDIPPVNIRGQGSSKALSKQRPFVISPRKLKTTKFLYGCAIHAFILKVTWITESISAGSLMLPDRYMIISNQADAMFIPIGKSLPHSNSGFIFGQVGIMLHGKKRFCNKFSEVIKHGGGVAYKTLQWLVRCLHNGKVSMGIIVTEYESRPSRHLRQCALERKIPIMMDCIPAQD